jgi:hypothetical protein
MPNFAGTRLMEGQSWSKKWPNMIDCGNGKIREPFEYRGGMHNRYYQETFCTYCGSEMLASESNFKKSKNSFCSAECKSSFTIKQNEGNKVFKKRPGGDHHVLVKKWDHPRADRHGYVYEHLLVAEKKLGRPVMASEIIHHINCVKEDNDPKNLYVCKNSKEHFLIHGSLNKCVADLMDIGILIFDTKTKQYKVKNDIPLHTWS